jgi:hypothetical protein
MMGPITAEVMQDYTNAYFGLTNQHVFCRMKEKLQIFLLKKQLDYRRY